MATLLAETLLPDTIQETTSTKRQRLASLDIVRGFTVALMVFVDEMGSAYPATNHSPWDAVTVADFVMPWFLFMVGTSISLSLHKIKSRGDGTIVVLRRSCKLFALGLLLQGGGWFGNYSYGYNLNELRVCGILNRIGYAYCCAALVEVWIPLRKVHS